MALFKEGIILKNNLLFKQTEKNYYCALCYGSWSSYVESSEVIFSSEATPTRIIPTITTGWDSTDFILVDFNINYPDDVIFNRIVLYYGGHQRSKYDITFNGFNSISIISPELNPFNIGDRVLINEYFYEVSSVSSMDLGLIPYENSPQLPHFGDSLLIDASGIPIVTSILDDIYIINNNDNVRFILNGTSSN